MGSSHSNTSHSSSHQLCEEASSYGEDSSVYDDSDLYSDEDDVSSYLSSNDDDDEDEPHQEEEQPQDDDDNDLSSSEKKKETVNGDSSENSNPVVVEVEQEKTTTPPTVDIDKLIWDASVLEQVITRKHILENYRSDMVVNMLSQEFDLESHTKLAIQMLEASPATRTLRFQLVPGRIKEHVFWATTFYLLQRYNKEENGTEEEDKENDEPAEVSEQKSFAEEEEENTEVSGRNGTNHHKEINGTTTSTSNNNINSRDYQEEETKVAEMNGTNHKDINGTSSNRDHPRRNHQLLSSTYGQSFQQVSSGHADSHATDLLKHQLKEKTWKILELEKQLQEAKKTIQELEENAKQQGQPVRSSSSSMNGTRMNGTAATTTTTVDTSCISGDTTTQTTANLENNNHFHSGTWILSKDAQDFLALDDELKENLRREKQKRLEDVKQQMKFILETDDVQDSTGEWSCCHATNYKTKGCLNNGGSESGDNKDEHPAGNVKAAASQQQQRSVPETHRSASAIL